MRKLFIATPLAAAVLAAIAAAWTPVADYFANRSRYHWVEATPLPGEAAKVQVARAAIKVERLPSRDSYTLQVLADKHTTGTGQWRSRDYGRQVLKPVGLYRAKTGNFRLVTVAAGGAPDAKLPWNKPCLLYYTFEHRDGTWQYDREAPTETDMKVFAYRFNLYPESGPVDEKLWAKADTQMRYDTWLNRNFRFDGPWPGACVSEEPGGAPFARPKEPRKPSEMPPP